MKLMMAKIIYRANPPYFSLKKIISVTIMMLITSLIALIFGGIVVLFPSAFSAQLIMLIGGVVLLISSMLVPGNAKVPFTLMRRLFFLLVIVLVLWPEYLGYHGLPGPGITPTRLIFWSLAGIWAFWFTASKGLRVLLYERILLVKPFLFFLVAYIGWGGVCAITSEAPYYSLHYFAKLMIGPLLVFVFALSCLRDRRDVDFTFFLIVVAALVSCVIGYIEIIKGINLFFGYVPSLVDPGDEQALDLADKVAYSKLLETGSNRIWSTFTNPLTFGEYLTLTFPLALFVFVFSKKYWQRVVGLITMPVIIGMLYYSQTRSALIATGLVLASLVLALGIRAIRQKRSFAVSIAGAFSIVILIFSVFLVAGVVTDMVIGRNAAEVGSSFARVMMLERGTVLILNAPILGYGPGLSGYILGLLPGFREITIDNYYLSVALETGLPGLMLFIGLLIYPIIKGVIVGFKIGGKDSLRIMVIIVALIGFAGIRFVLSLTNNIGFVFLFVSMLVVALEASKCSAARNE